MTARTSSIRVSRSGTAAGPVREAGAALVEADQPRERAEPVEEVRVARLLPVLLEVRDEAGHEHEVDRPGAGHLVGDAELAAPCVADRRARRAVCPQGARAGGSRARRAARRPRADRGCRSPRSKLAVGRRRRALGPRVGTTRVAQQPPEAHRGAELERASLPGAARPRAPRQGSPRPPRRGPCRSRSSPRSRCSSAS